MPPMASRLKSACLITFCLAIAVVMAATAKPPAHDLDTLLAAADAGNYVPLESGLAALDDPVDVAVANARVAAGRLDLPAARIAAETFAKFENPPPRRAAQLWYAVAAVALAWDDYPLAADAANRWLAAITTDDPQFTDAQNFASVATVLASAPRQAVISYTPKAISTAKDAADLTRASVTINGKAEDAVLDTGANLSTASETAAQRLGLRYLDGKAAVGSSTRATVSTQIAIADRLELAGVTLTNVVFLVLPDEQLKVPLPDYRLDVIIGFPVFRAMEHITFTKDGRLLPARSQPGLSAHNLRYAGNSLYVQATVGGQPVWMHVDSGARRSSLAAGFAAENRKIVEGLKQKTIQVAGAGGSVEQKVAIWPEVTVEIDGEPVRLPALTIALTPSKAGMEYMQGQVGQDVLGSFSSYTIDFPAGRLSVGKP